MTALSLMLHWRPNYLPGHRLRKKAASLYLNLAVAVSRSSSEMLLLDSFGLSETLEKQHIGQTTVFNHTVYLTNVKVTAGSDNTNKQVNNNPSNNLTITAFSWHRQNSL